MSQQVPKSGKARPRPPRVRSTTAPDLGPVAAKHKVQTVKVVGGGVKPPAPARPSPSGRTLSTSTSRRPVAGALGPAAAAAADAKDSSKPVVSGKSHGLRTKGALRSMSSALLPTSGPTQGAGQSRSDRQMRVVAAKSQVPLSPLVATSTKDESKSTTVRLPKRKPKAPRKSTTFVSIGVVAATRPGNPSPPALGTCAGLERPQHRKLCGDTGFSAAACLAHSVAQTHRLQ